MHSLYYVLTDQHRDEFAPLRCNEQTIFRLLRYFDDVVTENKLSALVVKGRCLKGEPARERRRLAELDAASRRVYLFSCDTECDSRTWNPDVSPTLTRIAERDYHRVESGPFMIVMEPRFSGLIASSVLPDEGVGHKESYEMVWTFDPNVVFTAIEYLMARLSAEAPQERDRFKMLLNSCTPRSSSLRLALSFTTKVTMLMQRQNDLEMSTNRISSASSGTLEIESILQSAVDEVGRALNARRAAIVLWQEGSNLPEEMTTYERPGGDPNADGTTSEAGFASAPGNQFENSPSDNGENPHMFNGGAAEMSRPAAGDPVSADQVSPSSLNVPISYRDNIIGELLVEDDTTSRNWEDEEVLMLKTVSDQLAVAISHARLFRHVQTQAMTDALTGLFNHRYFHEALDREIKLADRNNREVSLILLDLDHLKQVNDTHGHRSGDAVLLQVAVTMRSIVRETDICARYGGEEFVVILPQSSRQDTLHAAERLRAAIARTPIQRVGQVTASVGVATYPSGAKNKTELVEMADRAMYLAKAAGRNRVRTLSHRGQMSVDVSGEKD